jgi:hypothetical protein
MAVEGFEVARRYSLDLRVDSSRGLHGGCRCFVHAGPAYRPMFDSLLFCKSRQGKLVGSFAEFSASSNAWGELLGLMAAHLVLTRIATLYPNLSGKVAVYLDCEGAINKLENLPPLHLPEKCKHLNILKNILINCSNLLF